MTSRNQNIIFWLICIALAGLAAAVIVAIFNSETLIGLAMAITYAPRSPFPPRVMPCPVCKIDTVHHSTLSGEWFCWCGVAAKPEDIPSASPETGRHLFQITGLEEQ